MVAKKINKRITARKYMGDDIYSWAVFLDGKPAYTGLSKGQVSYYKSLINTQLEEADAKRLENKESKDA